MNNNKFDGWKAVGIGMIGFAFGTSVATAEDHADFTEQQRVTASDTVVGQIVDENRRKTGLIVESINQKVFLTNADHCIEMTHALNGLLKMSTLAKTDLDCRDWGEMNRVQRKGASSCEVALDIAKVMDNPSDTINSDTINNVINQVDDALKQIIAAKVSPPEGKNCQ